MWSWGALYLLTLHYMYISFWSPFTEFGGIFHTVMVFTTVRSDVACKLTTSLTTPNFDDLWTNQKAPILTAILVGHPLPPPALFSLPLWEVSIYSYSVQRNAWRQGCIQISWQTTVSSQTRLSNCDLSLVCKLGFVNWLGFEQATVPCTYLDMTWNCSLSKNVKGPVQPLPHMCKRGIEETEERRKAWNVCCSELIRTKWCLNVSREVWVQEADWPAGPGRGSYWFKISSQISCLVCMIKLK